eukprot:1161113-Pelagomonas_calceolata.AAC.1
MNSEHWHTFRVAMPDIHTLKMTIIDTHTFKTTMTGIHTPRRTMADTHTFRISMTDLTSSENVHTGRRMVPT